MPAPDFGHDSVEQVNSHSRAPWRQFTCAHCSINVNGATLARVHADSGLVAATWVRCTNCGEPTVFDSRGYQHPGVPGGIPLEGLPSDVAAAYGEARSTLAVSAFTSCELICRKILMHVAVDKGAREGDTFINYIDHLVSAGYVTPPMKGWVDLIRNHGNDATHKLEPPTRERADATLMFTATLLRMVYEMEHLTTKYVPPAQNAEVAPGSP